MDAVASLIFTCGRLYRRLQTRRTMEAETASVRASLIIVRETPGEDEEERESSDDGDPGAADASEARSLRGARALTRRADVICRREWRRVGRPRSFG